MPRRPGDLILVRDDLMDVVRSVRLGKATLAKVKQNLFWALFYNVAGIPLAAGALYYPFGVTLNRSSLGSPWPSLPYRWSPTRCC